MLHQEYSIQPGAANKQTKQSGFFLGGSPGFGTLPAVPVLPSAAKDGH